MQGDVELPQGPIQMIINSTPGGTCHHVEKELLDFSWRRKPDIMVLAAGTNNIGFGLESLDVACKQFRRLLRSALCMTPKVYIIQRYMLLLTFEVFFFLTVKVIVHFTLYFTLRYNAVFINIRVLTQCKKGEGEGRSV